jgi:phosphogluconate dehydratase
VNHFHAAGGLGLVIRELLDAGLLHEDIRCVHGGTLRAQAQEPYLDGLALKWRAPPARAWTAACCAASPNPSTASGGLHRLKGNLGRAVVKISAVKPEHRRIEAPAKVFDSQDALLAAFKAGALSGDFVAVIRGQGPRANGMPELHKLTPTLARAAGPRPEGRAADRRAHVRRLRQGAGGDPRLARGACGGAIAQTARWRPRRIDAVAGTLDARVDAAEWAARATQPIDAASSREGVGRELFGLMRANAGTAEEGACSLFVRA